MRALLIALDALVTDPYGGLSLARMADSEDDRTGCSAPWP
jgi:hypothetical protein